MARLDLFACDRCATVLGEPVKVQGHVLDLDIGETATDPPVLEKRRVDLCVACMTRAVKYLVDGMGYEAKKVWLDYAVKGNQETAHGR